MTTTENNNSANALIAEFMNHKLTFEAYMNGVLATLERPIKHYHSNWNLLMEVVEKIKLIYDEAGSNGDFRIKLLLFMRTGYTVYDLNIFSGKEAVCNACVEFIKWYNQNCKKDYSKELSVVKDKVMIIN